jgi:hypothetical protein
MLEISTGVQQENTSVIDLKTTHGSVRREALYNSLTEFGTPMKLV